MEDESTTIGAVAVDSVDALRMQLESSLSLAFDFDTDSATTWEPEEKVDGLDVALDDVDSVAIKTRNNNNNSNGFEILDLIASPSSWRPSARQTLGGSSVDLQNNTNIERQPPLLLQQLQPSAIDVANSYIQGQEAAVGADDSFNESGAIRQLVASPVVLRPKAKKKMGNGSDKVLTRQVAATSAGDEVATVSGKTNSITVDDSSGQYASTTANRSSQNSDGSEGGDDDGNNDDSNNNDDDDLFSGIIRQLEGSPAWPRVKDRPSVASSSTMTSSRQSQGSVSDEADVQSVKEMASRIDQQSAANIVTTTVKTGKRNSSHLTTASAASGAGCRMSAYNRAGARRKDNQRVQSYADDCRLTGDERRWTMSSACSDYQAIARMLKDSPSLAGRRDPVTGLTALHWAAKNGRVDVVKLLLGSAEPPPVDCRTRDAGHTPLHLAAMHCRHDVIELLAVVYRADCNAMDFAGRFPIHYLPRNNNGTRINSMTQLKPIDITSTVRLRSEALLKPSRQYVVAAKSIDASPPSPEIEAKVTRRHSVWSAIIGSGASSSAGIGISRSDSMSVPSITRNLVNQTSDGDTREAMLPPRQLPSITQRLAVSSFKVTGLHPMAALKRSLSRSRESVSSSGNEPESPGKSEQLRSCGSTPNFGSLV